MHAFVRFREFEGRFVAFFEPEHHIVRRAAGFFVDRFTNMRWSILTPELSIHWDGRDADRRPRSNARDAPSDDPLEETWRTYYASHFQSCAAEGRRNAEGDAQEILAQHARDLARSALDCGRAQAGSWK